MTGAFRSALFTHAALGITVTLSSFWTSTVHGDAAPTAARLRAALQAACRTPLGDEQALLRAFDGATMSEARALEVRGTAIGWRRHLTWPQGEELRIEYVAPQGRLRRVSVEYWSSSGHGPRPQALVVADSECRIRAARRLIYEAGSGDAVELEQLDADLRPTGEREALNPPVPPGKDPTGVLVAMVDSGVNYVLPQVAERLARDQQGEILGYDYWELDRRPFDSNPARSPFFPQRHGTRTASLLLAEAPGSRLVPYRYPRPDMGRMAELVVDLADKGVSIVNLALGSDDASEWQSFVRQAERHPGVLFVVSAGNNGRDIDAQPVYPAAFALDNLIVVTSAETNGELARGSNWGRRSVHLAVPAEGLSATDFNGKARAVSGSSYASVRVSALAARLLALNPGWRGPELKAAIFARALKLPRDRTAYVAVGYIPDPARAETRAVAHRPDEVKVHERYVWNEEVLYGAGRRQGGARYAFTPTLAYFIGTQWEPQKLQAMIRQAAGILLQCGLYMPRVEVTVLDGPELFRYYDRDTAEELVQHAPLPKPTVYFVRDTLQRPAYDAEAIGKTNGAARPALMYTVWVTEAIKDPGISLAHELAHVLMDSGEHVELPRNLMRADTSPDNTELTSDQCERIRNGAVANELVKPL